MYFLFDAIAAIWIFSKMWTTVSVDTQYFFGTVFLLCVILQVFYYVVEMDLLLILGLTE